MSAIPQDLRPGSITNFRHSDDYSDGVHEIKFMLIISLHFRIMFVSLHNWPVCVIRDVGNSVSDVTSRGVFDSVDSDRKRSQ